MFIGKYQSTQGRHFTNSDTIYIGVNTTGSLTGYLYPGEYYKHSSPPKQPPDRLPRPGRQPAAVHLVTTPISPALGQSGVELSMTTIYGSHRGPGNVVAIVLGMFRAGPSRLDC